MSCNKKGICGIASPLRYVKCNIVNFCSEYFNIHKAITFEVFERPKPFYTQK